ncbi:MAG: mannose-1-phosphate guanylyltransferase/mannose-6-phosphate isomerase [Methanolinea sp.]|nr:mannose-1-phosphate guanylyltransferase/mannose-6-phosphate isomerase [Methanolinea sp.]
MDSIKSVILAGGVGTRLWPLSRTYNPKQFLKLNGKSLFQETYRRALQISSPGEIYVVTQSDHQYLVRNQLEEMNEGIDDTRLLKEPVGKNTLPAITWAMGEIEKEYGKSLVAIFPSDHYLGDSAMEEVSAARAIAGDYLVTFGVPPTYPHTGYGYIAPGESLPIGAKVSKFREKPDWETAKVYVDAGYFWNSGMFLFSTEIFFRELARLQPTLYGSFRESGPGCYPELPSLSVDYGLLEHSDRVAVVPLQSEWTDLGTFRAWYEFKAHDPSGNAGDAEFIDSEGNFVHAPGKCVALIGIRDLVLVDTGDALLACRMDSTERVGDLVRRFRNRGNTIIDYHLQVHRPWGSYTELEKSRFFRIKRVTVKPGKKLSLQMHHHRSEHWIVVSGMADVILGDHTIHLRQGESTFVPAGTKHRLANTGKIPLEVIEVQIGEYLEEDDITRFADEYNRK